MVTVVTPHLLLGAAVLLLWAVVSRVAYVLLNTWFGSPTFLASRTVNTLVVLGSGGHTGEMLKLTQTLNPDRYRPLVYVVANTDRLSVDRVRDMDAMRRHKYRPGTRDAGSEDAVSPLEAGKSRADSRSEEGCLELRGRRVCRPEADLGSDLLSGAVFADDEGSDTATPESVVEMIPRSREVGQSFVTSVFSTVLATLHAAKVVLKHRPDVVLVNGPGSCVPVCLCGLFFRLLGVCTARITFVESLCRVRSLSLTGKILYWIADDFIVQWPELKEKYPRSKYLGRLV